MGRIQCHIDGLRSCKNKEKLRVYICGWCAVDGAGDYTLSIGTEKRKLSFLAEERVVRPDVAKALAGKGSVSEKALFGYYLAIELLPEETERKLILSAVKNGETKKIASWKLRSLEEMSGNAPVLYEIEQAGKTEKQAVIQGWAVSVHGEKLSYKLTDDRGRSVPVKERRMLRPELGLLFPDLDMKEEDAAGFRLKVENPQSAYYDLDISDSTETRTIRISQREFARAEKKGKKRYHALKILAKELRPSVLRHDTSVLVKKGPGALSKEWRDRYTVQEYKYDRWFRDHAVTAEELEKQRSETFAYAPKISVIVPVYHTPKAFLKQMIGSLQDQSYKNWELCLADGGTDDQIVERIVKKYMERDARIRYKRLTENKGIAGNTNEAMTLATGEWIALLDHDDILTPDALYEVVKAINEHPDAEAIYSDEDKVSMDLKTYFEPHFKSDFNPDLLRSNNYICHLFTAKKSLVDTVGWFNSEFDGSQDYDFILRCTERAKETYHIPKVLYHWRMHQNSTAADPESKLYCFEAGKHAIEAHLKRLGLKGEVSMFPGYYGFYRVRYEVQKKSKVSILIPNKDEKESLKKCVDSILEKTIYPNYEIVIVENNSTTKEIFEYYKELEQNKRVKVLTWKDKFNYSAINNFAEQNSDGEYLVLLNNDTEIRKGDWLELLLADVQQPGVGIVGAKLLYPDRSIQHAGVVIGLGGVAGHVFSTYPGKYMGCNGRAQLQQTVGGVTAACLMVSRSVYEEVGRLEEDIAVAFNDVDFCLKVRKAGYRIMYEPWVVLNHYESKSRGAEDTPEKQARFVGEVHYMEHKWGEELTKGDPYYGKNCLMELKL